jgi:hypothetical protein
VSKSIGTDLTIRGKKIFLAAGLGGGENGQPSITEGMERREIIVQETNPKSGVFQSINPPPPHRPERGVEGQYFGRRRHSSVLYICKYFVE